MNSKSLLSKSILLIASALIILNAIFLSRADKWSQDLFFYLPVFSLIIVLDFMFYELKCPGFKGRNHQIFCIFPVSRWNIFFMELRYYFKRWDLGIFLISILFYTSYFYFQSNSDIIPIILILILVTLQLTYLICLLFLVKNLIKIKNFNTDIKNFASILISFIILLVSFAGTSKIIEFIFFINPLSNGFLSYLLGMSYAMISYSLILLLAVSFFYIVDKRFNEWPLS